MVKKPLVAKQVYFDTETEAIHKALQEDAAEHGRIYNLSALTRQLVHAVGKQHGINPNPSE